MEVKKTMAVTRSGRIIDLAAPKVEDICITDVAWQLAHEIRWNGCLGPLSVAQHCVAVEEALSAEETPIVRLFGLLHDAAEAYTGDAVTPWKTVLNEYGDGQPWSSNEWPLQRVCYEALIGRWLNAEEQHTIAIADQYAAREEARRFGGVHWIDAIEKLAPGYARGKDFVVDCFTYDGPLWTPEQAAEKFLRRYSDLKKVL